MSYSTDPATDADRNEQARYVATCEHDATLSSVCEEIRAAFRQHFAGKPGVYIPAVTYRSGIEQEFGMPARAAVEKCVDYTETSAAMHAMLIGSGSVEQFREALVNRYIYDNAADIVEARCGLYVPTPSAIPKHIAEMAVSA